VAKQKKRYIPGFYHVAFSSKSRRGVLVGPVKERVAFWFETIAEDKGIGLIEYFIMPDHVHMLIELKRQENLSYQMQSLKGRTAREIFKEFDWLRMDAGVNRLWTKSFRSRYVPPGKMDVVLRYVRRQEEIHRNRPG
jgi:putative transposase